MQCIRVPVRRLSGSIRFVCFVWKPRQFHALHMLLLLLLKSPLLLLLLLLLLESSFSLV
jgi:hypothetical protein